MAESDWNLMRDFPLDGRMMAILRELEGAAWMVEHVKGAAAPAWNDDRELIFRFYDDDDADRFEARWLRA
jgi:hypothetical protein